MNLENDTRYKILKHLHEIGHTTEQVSSNKFLSELKTYNDKEDLGTILRCIIELDNEGFITENPNSIDESYRLISTNGEPIVKDPVRFIKDVKRTINDRVIPMIPPVYLYITLKGRRFLFDWVVASEANRNVKLRNRAFPYITAIAFIGGFVSIFTFYQKLETKAKVNDLEHKIELLQKSNNVQNKNEAFLKNKID